MAPTLKTEAQCIETPLNGKNLKYVSEKIEPETGNSPFYKVVVKKAEVRLKPSEKGGKKLKSVGLKKIDKMHVDERANMVALAIERKKKKMVCLAMKFREIAARERFQDLAKRNNPFIRFSTRDYALNDIKEDKSEFRMEQVTSSGYETAAYKNQNRVRSQNAPLSLQQSGEPSRWPSRYPSSSKADYYSRGGNQRPSSRHRTGSLDSYYHQSISPSEFSTYSMGSSKIISTSVSYVGPNGSTARIYRPRSRNPSLLSQKRDILDESTSINSSIRGRRDGGRKKGVVPITYVTPTHSRSFQKFKKPPLTASSRERNSRSNNRSQRNNSPVTCPVIYLLWDSSGEEESDYEDTESSSNYSDSLYSSASECSGRLESVGMLLRELHKQRNVRHW